MLFSQGIRAGEFAFTAQDARRSDGELHETSVQDQALRTVENLGLALKTAELDLGSVVSLMIYLPEYPDAVASRASTGGELRKKRRELSGHDSRRRRGSRRRLPCQDRCYSNIESRSHSTSAAGSTAEPGSRCHGVRVGNFFFLSGVDAADDEGNVLSATTIQFQTTEVLGRINRILNAQGLSLSDLCRTFMFMPSTDYRPGYGEARKKVYKGIFAEDEFPPNSGIYIRDLGPDILLRSMAIAYRGAKTVVASPKVRKAPGSFSQSVRVGDWLLLAGQDAVGFNREVEAEGDLAGQTEVTLQHIKDILEEAGGTLDDLVKTTVYLIAGQDRSRFAAAYMKFFNRYRRASKMPAGLTVEVRELSPRCLVEIDAVAYLGK